MDKKPSKANKIWWIFLFAVLLLGVALMAAGMIDHEKQEKRKILKAQSADCIFVQNMG